MLLLAFEPRTEAEVYWTSIFSLIFVARLIWTFTDKDGKKTTLTEGFYAAQGEEILFEHSSPKQHYLLEYGVSRQPVGFTFSLTILSRSRLLEGV